MLCFKPNYANGFSPMELSELPPKDGAQRAYCEACKGPLDLVFVRFHDMVSGIEIDMNDVPQLECPACGLRTLPDRTRFFIMHAHQIATKEDSPILKRDRNKIAQNFGFTDVPFQYDPDDYYYYPGLERPWDTGFLTPLFFNRSVLTKYDADPRYLIRFASPTYGDVAFEDQFSFPFGINRHGHLLMWLGDVAKLPKPEQYYLMSENRPSDHCIASEFYDAQIECIFTDQPRESVLFAARSDFLVACFERWGAKLAHLDTEVLDLAATLRRPVHDTQAKRHSVSDVLNKVHLESLDNAKIGAILSGADIECRGKGSLKRLQALLDTVGNPARVSVLMSPFYALYDFRIAYSHLSSSEGSAAKMKTVTDRLAIAADGSLHEIYDKLLSAMTASYVELTAIVTGDA